MKRLRLIFLFSVFITVNVFAQSVPELKEELEQLQNYNDGLDHKIDMLGKLIDDVLWYNKVGDIAHVDKLYIYGPPKWKEANPTAKDAGNPVKFWTYVFIPLHIDDSKKYPLIVLPHGGVHADFTTYYAHIVRELVSQGYYYCSTRVQGQHRLWKKSLRKD
jgi:hypothetical protein